MNINTTIPDHLENPLDQCVSSSLHQVIAQAKVNLDACITIHQMYVIGAAAAVAAAAYQAVRPARVSLLDGWKADRLNAVEVMVECPITPLEAGAMLLS